MKVKSINGVNMKKELSDYFLVKVRQGESNYKKDKLLSQVAEFNEVVIYEHDVYKYYYAVPYYAKDIIATGLLEFFYNDNYEYTDEQLKDFKEEYKEYFEGK